MSKKEIVVVLLSQKGWVFVLDSMNMKCIFKSINVKVRIKTVRKLLNRPIVISNTRHEFIKP